jgi:hypothetical protein
VNVGGRSEAQLAQTVQIAPHTLLERARGDRLGKECAERGAGAGPLFLDDSERTQLPGEIGQPF